MKAVCAPCCLQTWHTGQRFEGGRHWTVPLIRELYIWWTTTRWSCGYIHWEGLLPKPSSNWQITLFLPESEGAYWRQKHFNWGCDVSDIMVSYLETEVRCIIQTSELWVCLALLNWKYYAILNFFQSTGLENFSFTSFAWIWGFRIQMKILYHPSLFL